jgi:hypothetical protein
MVYFHEKNQTLMHFERPWSGNCYIMYGLHGYIYFIWFIFMNNTQILIHFERPWSGKILVYFKDYWCTLLISGKFFGLLVYFPKCCTKRNLATLAKVSLKCCQG